MTIIEAVKTLSSNDGFFRHWISHSQRVALLQSLRGEEREFFAQRLTDLKARIEAMPKSYETDRQGHSAIVYLHYFRGSVDAWIIERDRGDDTDDLRQHQAFGKVCLTGDKQDAELGYVSIEELIENGVELDLYWQPVTLRELK